MIYAFPPILRSRSSSAGRRSSRGTTARRRRFRARRSPPHPGDRVFREPRARGGPGLRFVLCCAPGTTCCATARRAVPVVPMHPPRPMTVDAIRSIAPAVSPMNAAILVRCPSAATRGPMRDRRHAQVGSISRGRGADDPFTIGPRRMRSCRGARRRRDAHLSERHQTRVAQSGAASRSARVHGVEFLPISRHPLVRRRGASAADPPAGHEPPRETSDFEWRPS